MAPTKFEDLRCWQRADALRSEVHAICCNSAVARDFRFCNSFRDAAGSVCRNISEGFGRFGSAHIVQFFTYALGSLNEVQDHAIKCRTRGGLDPARFDRLWDMAEHTRALCINFMKPHLRRLGRGNPWHAPRKHKRKPPEIPPADTPQAPGT